MDRVDMYGRSVFCIMIQPFLCILLLLLSIGRE